MFVFRKQNKIWHLLTACFKSGKAWSLLCVETGGNPLLLALPCEELPQCTTTATGARAAGMAVGSHRKMNYSAGPCDFQEQYFQHLAQFSSMRISGNWHESQVEFQCLAQSWWRGRSAVGFYPSLLGSSCFMALKSIKGSCHSDKSFTTENWRIQINGMNWILWRILCDSLDIMANSPQILEKERRDVDANINLFSLFPLGEFPCLLTSWGSGLSPTPLHTLPQCFPFRACARSRHPPVLPSSGIWESSQLRQCWLHS